MASGLGFELSGRFHVSILHYPSGPSPVWHERRARRPRPASKLRITMRFCCIAPPIIYQDALNQTVCSSLKWL